MALLYEPVRVEHQGPAHRKAVAQRGILPARADAQRNARGRLKEARGAVGLDQQGWQVAGADGFELTGFQVELEGGTGVTLPFTVGGSSGS